MGKSDQKKVQMPTLDLHGYVIADVVDAVDRFLVSCQRKGVHRCRIITGRGTGAVKKAATDWLKRGGFPFSPENEGSFVVHLDD